MIHFRGHLISIMVAYCIALHLSWAAITFADPSAIGATPVAALHRIFDDDGRMIAGLTGASMMAMVAIFLRAPWVAILLIPQQILLAISADGAAAAILYSHYADGVVRPRAFIAADQLHTILAAVGHAIAMLMHARGGR